MLQHLFWNVLIMQKGEASQKYLPPTPAGIMQNLTTAKGSLTKMVVTTKTPSEGGLDRSMAFRPSAPMLVNEIRFTNILCRRTDYITI